MGKGSGAFIFIMIIFIFSLLIRGSFAADNETNTSLNQEINSTINGTITGTVNSTINSTISTINGTINGTVNGIINGTTNGKTSGAGIFKLILLLPIFYGNLLFLSWISRFFDKMNFCYVAFILAALLICLLSLFFNIEDILRFFILPVIIIIIFLIMVAILCEIYSKWKKGHKIKEVDDISVISCLHDILRNFIILFLGLMWPLILLYFFLEGIEYLTFNGEKLKFPVYIIAASSIGILSYLFLSIEETFCQLIPEYKKLSIAWSYLRRITIAPFIALIGFYFLIHLQNIKEMNDINDYFVFIFAFFAGIFTKTIEEWIYAWVQKLLPGDKKNEFDARTEYEVKESEFVKKLSFDEDLAYALYSAKIRTIEELAACDAKNLKRRLNFDARDLGEQMGLSPEERKERYDSYSEQQIKMFIDRAQTYMNIDKSEFVTRLKMDKDHAFKLFYFANIKTLEDLKNCDPHEVHERVCDCKEEAEKLAKCKQIDFKRVHDILCWCSEENIKRLKEEAQIELESKNKVNSSPMV